MGCIFMFTIAGFTATDVPLFQADMAMLKARDLRRLAEAGPVSGATWLGLENPRNDCSWVVVWNITTETHRWWWTQDESPFKALIQISDLV